MWIPMMLGVLLSRPSKTYALLRIPSLFGRGSIALRCATSTSPSQPALPKNFIKNIIESDLAANRNQGRVITRFPPEPNGYLHLGHAKSICLNFGVAKEYGGVTNMRFDDTNPAKEDMEYVNSILRDVRWLASDIVGGEADPWSGAVRHASDYFDTFFEAAVYLIKEGKAYVDDSSPEAMREMRGTLTEPGVDSPFRERSVEENLRLFMMMKEGVFPDGHCVLRAKIDMSSPNLNLRDPTLYRIKRAPHPMTGDKWCIYPMYDFAHAISDAVEEITHSLCTLEFADHRPLYDWVINELIPSGVLPSTPDKRPTQIEFSRLNLQYTVLSKRKLIQLVSEGHVSGWDDPRMPTLCGVRRRGYPSAAVRLFCERVGISKAENNIDMSVLEDCARETLDETAPRAFGILDPIKVTITNYKDGRMEEFMTDKHPKRKELGERVLPFGRTVYIEREDFFDTGPNGENPIPPGFKRLVPGGQVRLKYAYVITCDEVIRDQDGKASELICSYNPDTRAGATPASAKRVKGIIQWVSTKHAVPIEAYLYDRLFAAESPGRDQENENFLLDLNPDSIRILSHGFAEPSVANSIAGDTFQFERMGYFSVDIGDISGGSSGNGRLRFNRIVTLKDTWAQRQSPLQQEPASTKVTGTDDDVLRVEIRVGRIITADRHPDADTLYVERVDLGPAGERTVISGLANHIPLDELPNRLVVVVCNLKPSKMRGILSEGMLLAASKTTENGEIVELVTPPSDVSVGELVRIEGLGIPQPDSILKSKTAQDMYKKVSSKFSTNAYSEATYEGKRFLVDGKPCLVESLKDACIR